MATSPSSVTNKCKTVTLQYTSKIPWEYMATTDVNSLADVKKPCTHVQYGKIKVHTCISHMHSILYNIYCYIAMNVAYSMQQIFCQNKQHSILHKGLNQSTCGNSTDFRHEQHFTSASRFCQQWKLLPTSAVSLFLCYTISDSVGCAAAGISIITPLLPVQNELRTGFRFSVA